MNAVSLAEAVRQDLWYALRTMRRNPVFALTAVLTLALGIGANTAIFTVVHAVLLAPLNYPEPDRLLRITGGATVARFEALRQAGVFSGVAAFPVYTETVTLAAADVPEPLKGSLVTTNFLDVLGLPPLLGRSFLAEEEQRGSQVALISAELWQRRWGSDPEIVGATVTLAGAPHTIIGVLPPGIHFPFPDVDVWRPWQPDAMPERARLNSPILSVFGRLRPGADIEQANAEVAVINRRYALDHPDALDAKPFRDRPEGWRPDPGTGPVTPLKENLVKNVRSMLWMLFGAVVFVLLIACANVAGLLLARATSRSRELAVRAAVGAVRGRLIGQLLTEGVLLATIGGTLGIVLASWSLRGISLLPGLELPRVQEIHMDATVVTFAIALSVLTSMLFGLAPALSASRPNLVQAMSAGGGCMPSAYRGRWRTWLSPRAALVLGQVALSIVLLTGTALLLESLARLRGIDPGFEPDNLLTMRIALPQAHHEELVQRVESIPGVTGAAVTLTLPMTGYAGTPVQPVGEPPLKLNERPIAILQAVTPGYFRTLGIPFSRGRDFTAQDDRNAQGVAIINERLARRFWPAYPDGENPIGHNILAGASTEPLEIIGIVHDVRQAGLADEGGMGIYRPRSQTPEMSSMFAVRTQGDPLRFAGAIRRQVAAIDPTETITAVKTMTAIVEDSEGQRRSTLVLLGSFAAAGLLLAALGIYGVVAYSAVQRSKELGIRRALGAQNRDILRLILGQGLSLAAAGAALGVAGALALTRVMQGLLFEVRATDPFIFSAVTLLLVLVASAASYLPARRAARIEPTTVLRGE